MRPSELPNGTGLADLPGTGHKQRVLVLCIEISQIVVDFTLNHQFFRLSNIKIANFVRFSNYFYNIFARFSIFSQAEFLHVLGDGFHEGVAFIL